MQEFSKYRELFPNAFPFESLLALYAKQPAALHFETSDIVYRIAITGVIDQAFFLPSILEDRNKARYAATRITSISLADWSLKKGNSHVDWWIFAGMAPFTDFEVV